MADLQLDGLSSGIPTEQIINQLMQYEMIPKQSLQEDKVELQTEKDAWRDVNSRIDSLESKLTQLKLSSTFNSNTASSSNEDLATASATNDATEGSYEVDITNIAQAHRVSSDQQSSSTDSLGYASEGDVSEFEITVDGDTKTVTVNDDYSLNDVKETINNTEDIGVEASIINDTLVVTANKTGTANEISFNDVDTSDSMVLENLGVIDNSNNILNELDAAEDASLTINDINVSSSSNSITDAVEGVTFNIEDTGTATINVSADTEQAVSAVQEFVDQYNSVMDFIDTKTNYDPDTDDAAVLQGDSTLMRLQMRIRSMFTEKVDTTGDYDSVYAAGISIDRDGVMSLDSGELTDALEEAPEEVMNLFKAESDDEGFDGIATRLDSYLDQLIQTNTGTIPERLDYYDKQIDRVEDDIADLDRQLESTRERYIEQFTAMEKAISEMQQQQSWMMSQLSGMSSGGTSSLLNSMM